MKYLDFLALEEEIEVSISDRVDAVVDGHDSGLGEFNIFIHTNDPRNLFEQVGEFMGTTRPTLAFAAGYRAFEDGDYTSLHPRSSTTFTVL